jgi:hypothetical protein
VGCLEVGCRDVSTSACHDEVGDAKSAYRISPFSQGAGDSEPFGWRFCLRPLESVAKRVLFSYHAASAKVRTRSKTQILKGLFTKVFQLFNSPFLRFTRGE